MADIIKWCLLFCPDNLEGEKNTWTKEAMKQDFGGTSKIRR